MSLFVAYIDSARSSLKCLPSMVLGLVERMVSSWLLRLVASWLLRLVALAGEFVFLWVDMLEGFFRLIIFLVII